MLICSVAIPTRSHAFFLKFIYILDGLSSPTIRVHIFGEIPVVSENIFTSSTTDFLILPAISFPYIISAVI